MSKEIVRPENFDEEPVNAVDPSRFVRLGEVLELANQFGSDISALSEKVYEYEVLTILLLDKIDVLTVEKVMTEKNIILATIKRINELGSDITDYDVDVLKSFAYSQGVKKDIVDKIIDAELKIATGKNP